MVRQSPKLKSAIWQGSWLITRKISNLLFELKPEQKKAKILHHDWLKLYISDNIPERLKKAQEKLKPGTKAAPSNLSEAIVLPTTATTPTQSRDTMIDTEHSQNSHANQGTNASSHVKPTPLLILVQNWMRHQVGGIVPEIGDCRYIHPTVHIACEHSYWRGLPLEP